MAHLPSDAQLNTKTTSNRTTELYSHIREASCPPSQSFRQSFLRLRPFFFFMSAFRQAADFLSVCFMALGRVRIPRSRHSSPASFVLPFVALSVAGLCSPAISAWTWLWLTVAGLILLSIHSLGLLLTSERDASSCDSSPFESACVTRCASTTSDVLSFGSLASRSSSHAAFAPDACGRLASLCHVRASSTPRLESQASAGADPPEKPSASALTAPPSPRLSRQRSGVSLPPLDIHSCSDSPSGAPSSPSFAFSSKEDLKENRTPGSEEDRSEATRVERAEEFFLACVPEPSEFSHTSDTDTSCALVCAPSATRDATPNRSGFASAHPPATFSTVELSPSVTGPSTAGKASQAASEKRAAACLPPATPAVSAEREDTEGEGTETVESGPQPVFLLSTDRFSHAAPTDIPPPLEAPAAGPATSRASKGVATLDAPTIESPVSFIGCLPSGTRDATHSTLPSPSAVSAFPLPNFLLDAGERTLSATSVASSEVAGEGDDDAPTSVLTQPPENPGAKSSAVSFPVCVGSRYETVAFGSPGDSARVATLGKRVGENEEAINTLLKDFATSPPPQRWVSAPAQWPSSCRQEARQEKRVLSSDAGLSTQETVTSVEPGASAAAVSLSLGKSVFFVHAGDEQSQLQVRPAELSSGEGSTNGVPHTGFSCGFGLQHRQIEGEAASGSLSAASAPIRVEGRGEDVSLFAVQAPTLAAVEEIQSEVSSLEEGEQNEGRVDEPTADGKRIETEGETVCAGLRALDAAREDAGAEREQEGQDVFQQPSQKVTQEEAEQENAREATQEADGKDNSVHSERRSEPESEEESGEEESGEQESGEGESEEETSEIEESEEETSEKEESGEQESGEGESEQEAEGEISDGEESGSRCFFSFYTGKQEAKNQVPQPEAKAEAEEEGEGEATDNFESLFIPIQPGAETVDIEDELRDQTASEETGKDREETCEGKGSETAFVLAEEEDTQSHSEREPRSKEQGTREEDCQEGTKEASALLSREVAVREQDSQGGVEKEETEEPSTGEDLGEALDVLASSRGAGLEGRADEEKRQDDTDGKEALKEKTDSREDEEREQNCEEESKNASQSDGDEVEGQVEKETSDARAHEAFENHNEQKLTEDVKANEKGDQEEGEEEEENEEEEEEVEEDEEEEVGEESEVKEESEEEEEKEETEEESEEDTGEVDLGDLCEASVVRVAGEPVECIKEEDRQSGFLSFDNLLEADAALLVEDSEAETPESDQERPEEATGARDIVSPPFESASGGCEDTREQGKTFEDLETERTPPCSFSGEEAEALSLTLQSSAVQRCSGSVSPDNSFSRIGAEAFPGLPVCIPASTHERDREEKETQAEQLSREPRPLPASCEEAEERAGEPVEAKATRELSETLNSHEEEENGACSGKARKEAEQESPCEDSSRLDSAPQRDPSSYSFTDSVSEVHGPHGFERSAPSLHPTLVCGGFSAWEAYSKNFDLPSPFPLSFSEEAVFPNPRSAGSDPLLFRCRPEEPFVFCSSCSSGSTQPLVVRGEDDTREGRLPGGDPSAASPDADTEKEGDEERERGEGGEGKPLSGEPREGSEEAKAKQCVSSHARETWSEEERGQEGEEKIGEERQHAREQERERELPEAREEKTGQEREQGKAQENAGEKDIEDREAGHGRGEEDREKLGHEKRETVTEGSVGNVESAEEIREKGFLPLSLFEIKARVSVTPERSLPVFSASLQTPVKSFGEAHADEPPSERRDSEEKEREEREHEGSKKGRGDVEAETEQASERKRGTDSEEESERDSEEETERDSEEGSASESLPVLSHPVPDETHPSERRSFTDHFIICTRSPSELSRQSSGVILQGIATINTSSPATSKPESSHPLRASSRSSEASSSVSQLLPALLIEASRESEEADDDAKKPGENEASEERPSPAAERGGIEQSDEVEELKGECERAEWPVPRDFQLGQEDAKVVFSCASGRREPLCAGSQEFEGEADLESPVACADSGEEACADSGKEARASSPVFGSLLASLSVPVSFFGEAPVGSEGAGDTQISGSALALHDSSASGDDSPTLLASSLSPVWGGLSKSDSPASCFSFSAKQPGQIDDKLTEEKEEEDHSDADAEVCVRVDCTEEAIPNSSSHFSPSSSPSSPASSSSSLLLASASSEPPLSPSSSSIVPGGVSPSIWSSPDAPKTLNFTAGAGVSLFLTGSSRAVKGPSQTRRLSLFPRLPPPHLDSLRRHVLSRAKPSTETLNVRSPNSSSVSRSEEERLFPRGKSAARALGKKLQGKDTEKLDRPSAVDRKGGFLEGTATISVSRGGRRKDSSSEASPSCLRNCQSSRLSTKHGEASCARSSAAPHRLQVCSEDVQPRSSFTSFRRVSRLPDITEEREGQTQESGEFLHTTSESSGEGEKKIGQRNRQPWHWGSSGPRHRASSPIVERRNSLQKKEKKQEKREKKREEKDEQKRETKEKKEEKEERKAWRPRKEGGRRRIRDLEITPHEARLPSPPETVRPRKFRPVPMPRKDNAGSEVDTIHHAKENSQVQDSQQRLSSREIYEPALRLKTTPEVSSSVAFYSFCSSLPSPDSGDTECVELQSDGQSRASGASSFHSHFVNSPARRETDRNTEETPQAAPLHPVEGQLPAQGVTASSTSLSSTSAPSAFLAFQLASASSYAPPVPCFQHNLNPKSRSFSNELSTSTTTRCLPSAVSHPSLPAKPARVTLRHADTLQYLPASPGVSGVCASRVFAPHSCAARSLSAPPEASTMRTSSPQSNSPSVIVPLTRAEAEEMHKNNPRLGRRPWLCGDPGVERPSRGGSARKLSPQRLRDTRVASGKDGFEWCSSCCVPTTGSSSFPQYTVPGQATIPSPYGTIPAPYWPGAAVAKPGSPTRVYYGSPEAPQTAGHLKQGAGVLTPPSTPVRAGPSPLTPPYGRVFLSPAGVSVSPGGAAACPTGSTGCRYTPGMSPESPGRAPHSSPTTTRMWRSVTPPPSRLSSPSGRPDGVVAAAFPAYPQGAYVPSYPGLTSAHRTVSADPRDAGGFPRPYYVASAQPTRTEMATGATPHAGGVFGPSSVSKTVLYQSAQPYQGVQSSYAPTGSWVVPPSRPIVSTVPTPSFGPAGVTQAPGASVGTPVWAPTHGSRSPSGTPPRLEKVASPGEGSAGQGQVPESPTVQIVVSPSYVSTSRESPQAPAPSPASPGPSEKSPGSPDPSQDSPTSRPGEAQTSCRRLSSPPLGASGGLSGSSSSLAAEPGVPAGTGVPSSLFRMASVPVNGVTTVPVECGASRKTTGESVGRHFSHQGSASGARETGGETATVASEGTGSRTETKNGGAESAQGERGRTLPPEANSTASAQHGRGNEEGGNNKEDAADRDDPVRKGFWFRTVSTNEDCDEFQWNMKNALSDPGDHMLNTLDKLAKVQDRLDFLQQQVQQQTKELQTYYSSYKTAEAIKNALETSMSDCTVCYSRRSTQLNEVEKRLKILTAETLTGCSTAELEELAQELETTLYKMTAVQTQRAAGVAEFFPDNPPRQLLPFSSDCLPEPKTTFTVPEEPVTMVAVDDCVTLGEEIDTEMADVLKDLKQAQQMHEAFRKEYKRIQMQVDQEVNVFDVDLRKLTSVEKTLEERLRRLLCLTGDTDYADVSESDLQEYFRTVNYAVRRVYRHLALKEAGHTPPAPAGSATQTETKKIPQQSHPRATRTSNSGPLRRPPQEDTQEAFEPAFRTVADSTGERTSPSLRRGRSGDSGLSPRQRTRVLGPLPGGFLGSSLSRSMQNLPTLTGEQAHGGQALSRGQAALPWRQGLQTYRLVVTPQSRVSSSASLSVPQEFNSLQPLVARGSTLGRVARRQVCAAEKERHISQEELIAGVATPPRQVALKADAGRDASRRIRRVVQGEQFEEEGCAIEDGQNVSGSDQEGLEELTCPRRRFSSGPFLPEARDQDRQLVPHPMPHGSSRSVLQEDLGVMKEERADGRRLRASLLKSPEEPFTRGRLESAESVISAISYTGHADPPQALGKMPFASGGGGNLLLLSPSVKPGSPLALPHVAHVPAARQTVSRVPLTVDSSDKGSHGRNAGRQQERLIGIQQESLEPESEEHAHLYQLQEVREKPLVPHDRRRVERERRQSTGERSNRREETQEEDATTLTRRQLAATASAGTLPCQISSLVPKGGEMSREIRAVHPRATGEHSKPVEERVEREEEPQRDLSGERRHPFSEGEGPRGGELEKSLQLTRSLPEGKLATRELRQLTHASPSEDPSWTARRASGLERGFSVKLLRDGSVCSNDSVYLSANLVESGSRRGTIESALELIPEKNQDLPRQKAGRPAITGGVTSLTFGVPHNSLPASDEADSPGLHLAHGGADTARWGRKREKRHSAALEALGQSEHLPGLRQLAVKSASSNDGRNSVKHGDPGRIAENRGDRGMCSTGHALAHMECSLVPSKAPETGRSKHPAIATTSVSALPAPETRNDEKRLDLAVRSGELCRTLARPEEANVARPAATELVRDQERQQNRHELARLGEQSLSTGSRHVSKEQARSGQLAPMHVEYPPSEMNTSDSSGDEMSGKNNSGTRNRHRDSAASSATGVDEAERRTRIGSLPDENSNDVFVSAASWFPPEEEGSE
ncbi:UNVERIFIED_CONTAM: hypothetical protein HHA_311230 [Hammondia hammondi]|eukprot:XP_008885881.1 hypothetical protein HHA_311230 [Hammondia hammondi]